MAKGNKNNENEMPTTLQVSLNIKILKGEVYVGAGAVRAALVRGLRARTTYFSVGSFVQKCIVVLFGECGLLLT